jgi:uncharacterized protein
MTVVDTDAITAVDVARIVQNDPELSWLVTQLRDRLRDGDDSHALDHLLRVGAWAARLTKGRPTVRLAIATALLHDVINTRKDSPDRTTASERSAELAERLLTRMGFPSHHVMLAADAIRSHSRSRGLTPRTSFGRAFQDADRLDSLGVIGIMRSLSTGAQLAQEILRWDDPWAERRPLAPKRYTVDHILADLFPLPASMHVAAARAEGFLRVGTMVDLLAAWGAQMGHRFPSIRYRARASVACGDAIAPTRARLLELPHEARLAEQRP